MTFARPVLLWLLPLCVAVVAGFLVPLPPRERRKRAFPAAIRIVLLALLVLALADPHRVHPVDGRAVALLVDVSKSVPDGFRAGLTDWVERARAARRGEDAECVILFAGGAGLEVPFSLGPGDPAPPLDLDRPRSRVGRDATDIAGAMRLALATFPAGMARRIVLVTDGNENRGDAVEEARRAAGEGVEILALPVRFERRGEVSVARVDAPASLPPGAVLAFTPILTSTDADRPAVLRAFVDRREVARTDAVLARGKSRGPEFRVFVPEPGIHEVSVSVDSPGDGVPENNEARAGVRVEGRAGVIVSEGDGSATVFESLAAMGLPVTAVAPERLYESPLYYQPADTVVLSDVSALDLTAPQMEALEIAVRDLGVGLVVLGGEQAFGPGGYGGTPLERCLPVRMDVREKQVMLNGALVLVLHTCEFPNGNTWAVRIAQDSIRSLAPTDYAGVVIFGLRGDDWLIPLAPVEDPNALAAGIDAVPAGDMPSFDPSLRLAYEALKPCPAYMKHIVVISDGDAAPPDPALVKAIAAEKISVSAVCIHPHGGSDTQSMKDLAQWGRGRYYELTADQVESLPRIFVKEATTLRRQAIRRKPFVPRFTVAAADLPPALRGFGGPLPSLDAFCLTEAKERAEVPVVTPDSDPVLAFWRYGLGQSAVFTSALKEGWLGAWADWGDFDRLLAQVVRSTFREAGRSGFTAEAEVRGGAATFRIAARTEGGEDMDFLRFEATASRPGEPPRPVPVTARGGGTYEGSFPVEGAGSYVVVARYEDPGGGPVQQIEIPVTVSYPEEYAALGTADPFFARLRDEAGARIIDPEEDVFAGPRSAAEGRRPLAPLLLLLAAILLPFDVFVRRTGFSPRLRLPRIRLPRRAGAARRPPAAPVPDRVPDAGAPPEPPPREEPPSPPEAGERDEAPESMEGLLEAKKRARRKRRWEETGN